MGVRWPSLTVLLVIAAAGLAPLGCKSTACVQWSESRGACPSQEEALAYLTPSCDELTVSSVLSEAEQEDGLCCYDVEESDENIYVCNGFAEFGVDDRPPPPPGSSSGP